MRILNGVLIRQIRAQQGWDQKSLAKAANVHPSVISRVERNLQEDVKLSVAIAIANALGGTIDSLLNRETWQPNELAPELLAVINQLRQRDEHTQRQAAGILSGYLSTLGK